MSVPSPGSEGTMKTVEELNAAMGRMAESARQAHDASAAVSSAQSTSDSEPVTLQATLVSPQLPRQG